MVVRLLFSLAFLLTLAFTVVVPSVTYAEFVPGEAPGPVDQPADTDNNNNSGSGGGGASSPCTPSGGNFFEFPTWYKYLELAGKFSHNSATNRCELAPFGDGGMQVTDLSLIGLALVDIAFRLVGLVAVAYVIWGGIQFVTAQGESDKTKKARQTIINALIGIAISLIAVGFVAFIGSRIGG
jgi:hypothetical protein